MTLRGQGLREELPPRQAISSPSTLLEPPVSSPITASSTTSSFLSACSSARRACSASAWCDRARKTNWEGGERQARCRGAAGQLGLLGTSFRSAVSWFDSPQLCCCWDLRATGRRGRRSLYQLAALTFGGVAAGYVPDRWNGYFPAIRLEQRNTRATAPTEPKVERTRRRALPSPPHTPHQTPTPSPPVGRAFLPDGATLLLLRTR